MNNLYHILIVLLLIVTTIAVPTEIDAKSFSLTTDMTTLKESLDALVEGLESKRVSVSQVMDSANRDREALCNSGAYEALEANDPKGFCWQDGDDAVEYWYPQGITTTHDALDAGEFDEHQLILVSWYHKKEEEGNDVISKGVRVTFVDWDGDWPNKYRHVLLVVPTPDGDYLAVEDLHAGGVMWYGNLLYVVDTDNGLRIFDMEHIYEVDDSVKDKIGKDLDKYYAYGYKYVMPQTGSLDNSGDDFRYSYVSLDRATTPDSFIVGEFCEPDNTTCGKRVVRYPLDFKTRLPAEGDGKETVASEAYNTDITQVQGALSRDGKFWFGSSKGENSKGILSIWSKGDSEVQEYSWAVGSEDMSYWADPNGEDLLWTVTEYPNARVAVSTPQSLWLSVGKTKEVNPMEPIKTRRRRCF